MSINLSGRALKRLRLPVVNYYSSAYQVMSAQAGDVNTRYLDVVLYDDRGDIDLSAYSKVYLQVQAYDGISPQMSEGWIDTERNRAVCRLTSSMLQYTGSKMPCNIWLVGTDADDEPMSLTSQTFYVMVYEGHGGADAEPSEDELTALQSAINDVVELEKTVGEAEANRQENFRSVYIKYSFDANGYNYTDSWQQGQQYMGVANTPKEPEDATGFSWILISGGSSGGSAVTVVGKNGYGFYRLVGEYTDDTTDVATEDIQRRADREVQAGDMLITSEGLIFVLDEYDADNDTQKVSYYTDIGGSDVSEEAIAAAVEMYMSENEIGGIGADDIDIVDSDGSYKLILTKDGEHIGSGVNMPAYTAEDVGAAEKDHNHDEKYQPKGNYAAEGHNHDGKYQPVGNYLTEESDPTVPSWAKQPAKPTYTADEVNARPNTWMPTAEDVGARPSTWTPTATDVGADAIVTDHNAATDSHNDIRLLIQGLDARLTALADSDDTTLDQLSELVAYIKANRGLIEIITTDKVDVDDIINNLTTNDAQKPLSAEQGVALKALIDSLTTTVNGKQTSEQVATAISNALKAYPTTTAMQTAISTALADYAKADHNHDGVYATKDHNHDSAYIKQTELSGAVDTALQAAKESGEFDGESVTVSKVTESSESGGDNVVEFSDGKTLIVKNGKGGSKGDKGDPYTLTEADKTEIANKVIEHFGGSPVQCVVTDDAKIILTGVPVGTYTAYFDMGDGKLAECGVLTLSNETPLNTYRVTFVADDVTVDVVEYTEGDTTLSRVPAVPEKDGYTGAWGSYDISKGGNITVNAVYTEIPANTYPVTKNATYCTISGNDSATEDEAYTATVTANSGYEMSSIKVTMTMGGVDTDITSSAVNGSNINITNVTGHIVITATATKVITNWIPISTDEKNQPISENGLLANTRLSLSSGNASTASGCSTTGFIPVQYNDQLYLEDTTISGAGNEHITMYKDSDDGPIRMTASGNTGTTLSTFFTASGDGYIATLNSGKWSAISDVIAFIRISSPTLTENTVLRIKRDGEWL